MHVFNICHNQMHRFNRSYNLCFKIRHKKDDPIVNFSRTKQVLWIWQLNDSGILPSRNTT